MILAKNTNLNILTIVVPISLHSVKINPESAVRRKIRGKRKKQNIQCLKAPIQNIKQRNGTNAVVVEDTVNPKINVTVANPVTVIIALIDHVQVQNQSLDVGAVADIVILETNVIAANHVAAENAAIIHDQVC
jgi:hypothetical protein